MQGSPQLRRTENRSGDGDRPDTSGLNNQMWATIVDRDGVVCAVAFRSVDRGAQWPGSRVISAQKANKGDSVAGAFSFCVCPIIAVAQKV